MDLSEREVSPDAVTAQVKREGGDAKSPESGDQQADKSSLSDKSIRIVFPCSPGWQNSYRRREITPVIFYRSPKILSPEQIARKKERRDKWKQKKQEKKANRRCCICGILGRDLVTGQMVIDHNHFTGWIRGWLCDPCNGRLGQFEHWTKKGYSWADSPMLDWIVTYYDKIIEHLNRNTGLKYAGGRSKFLRRP